MKKIAKADLKKLVDSSNWEIAKGGYVVAIRENLCLVGARIGFEELCSVSKAKLFYAAWREVLKDSKNLELKNFSELVSPQSTYVQAVLELGWLATDQDSELPGMPEEWDYQQLDGAQAMSLFYLIVENSYGPDSGVTKHLVPLCELMKELKFQDEKKSFLLLQDLFISSANTDLKKLKIIRAFANACLVVPVGVLSAIENLTSLRPGLRSSEIRLLWQKMLASDMYSLFYLMMIQDALLKQDSPTIELLKRWVNLAKLVQSTSECFSIIDSVNKIAKSRNFDEEAWSEVLVIYSELSVNCGAVIGRQIICGIEELLRGKDDPQNSWKCLEVCSQQQKPALTAVIFSNVLKYGAGDESMSILTLLLRFQKIYAQTYAIENLNVVWKKTIESLSKSLDNRIYPKVNRFFAALEDFDCHQSLEVNEMVMEVIDLLAQKFERSPIVYAKELGNFCRKKGLQRPDLGKEWNKHLAMEDKLWELLSEAKYEL